MDLALHVKAYQRANPGVSYGRRLTLAQETYGKSRRSMTIFGRGFNGETVESVILEGEFKLLRKIIKILPAVSFRN